MPHRLIPLAGSQVGAYGYVDAPVGLDARFNCPWDCELSKDRNYLYVGDYGNNVIRRITLSGSYPVETFCPAPGAEWLHVNPTTGNLWFISHEGAEFHTRKHHITKVTPNGTVRIMHTIVGEWYYDCLPDPAERYMRIKGSTTYIPPNNTWYFYNRWWILDLAAGAMKVHSGDGNYSGSYSAQMWSKNHPDTYFWHRAYQYPSDQGASLGRTGEFGAPFEYDITRYGGTLHKMVNLGQDGPNETYIGMGFGGTLSVGSFNADSSAPWISPSQASAPFGLPQIPAVMFARDHVSDVYYFPMNGIYRDGGSNWPVKPLADAGLSYNIPKNTVSVAVPNNHLSVVIHSPGSGNPGDV